jgi:hypothetical protein
MPSSISVRDFRARGWYRFASPGNRFSTQIEFPLQDFFGPVTGSLKLRNVSRFSFSSLSSLIRRDIYQGMADSPELGEIARRLYRRLSEVSRQNAARVANAARC